MSLLNCAPSRLRPLPIIDTRLTFLRALLIINTRHTRLPHLTRLCPNQNVLYAPFSCLVTNTVVSVGPSVKKFNKVRNDHGNTQIWEFSVLDRKHPFCTNLAQKFKVLRRSWNLIPRTICSKKSKLSVLVEICYLY